MLCALIIPLPEWAVFYRAQGPFPVPCEHDYFSFECTDVESFGLEPVLYYFYCGLCALPDYVKVISFC